jgi:catechol 2,3-dioxygenase-like lactoylglutathione lyase family enzyme
VTIADRAGTQQITFLDTRDLTRTADFYERILDSEPRLGRRGPSPATACGAHYGLRLARDQGICRIYHVSGTAYLGFCQRPDAPAEPQGITLTLVTDRVDDWCAQLKREGVEFVKEAADNPPYRIYNAFVRDPNGYLIEIQRFWEPLV